MKIRTSKALIGLFVCGATAILSAKPLQAQSAEDVLRPKVVRKQDNGMVFYQKIILDKARFQFSESKQSLHCWGGFIDYGIVVNEQGQIARADLELNSSSERLFLRPPGSALIPAANATSYTDLNGDSVLDTMIKNGPQGRSRYILYKNTWTEVRDTRGDFAVGQPEYSLESKSESVPKFNSELGFTSDYGLALGQQDHGLGSTPKASYVFIRGVWELVE